MTARPLKDFRRITVKIGSALLVDRKKGLKRDWLSSMVDDIAALAAEGTEVLVVSSGAIALGRTILGLTARSLPLEESQAAAAVGQIALAGAWSEELRERGLKSGQILVTLGEPRAPYYLNARATISTLLKLAVPVINENDTVATSEIRYGDNDRLAARVATMMNSTCWSSCPTSMALRRAAGEQSDAGHSLCHRITPQIEAMAAARHRNFARYATKIDGARSTIVGTSMIIRWVRA